MLHPHYCEKCGQLTFRYYSAVDSASTDVDFNNNLWEQHPCANIVKSGEPVAETKIEFRHVVKSKTTKLKELSVTVIFSCDETGESSALFQTITPENQIVSLKIPTKNPSRLIGKAINIKNSVRIGKNKYRVNRFKEFPPPNNLEEITPISGQYFQVALASTDQEQLENAVDRLLTGSKKGLSRPSMVIAQPVTKADEQQVFHREILYNWSSSNLSAINSLDFPESVTVLFKQIDAPVTT